MEPLDLLNSLALGCCQPFPEVWIISYYHAQFGYSHKGRAIKGLVVYNGWVYGAFGPVKLCGLCCSQSSPEVCIVSYYHAQFRLPHKGRAIKGLVVYNGLAYRAFRPAKQSGRRLLSTVPWGTNRIVLHHSLDLHTKVVKSKGWLSIIVGILSL